MSQEFIRIRGARQHNLKNISLDIPRNKLVVITGLSGSGKSSLAFDTIYAEGQRRYVESLSAYARQFLELMEKPDVDVIEGLSPAIAIEQRVPSRNPRSTVATVTEIYDYLRLLYARAGTPHCPKCHIPIKPQSASQIVEEIARLPAGTKLQVLGPLVRGRKGEYREVFDRLRAEGYARVRVDGKIHGLEEDIRLDRYKMHSIEVVVDRLVVDAAQRKRLADSVETALKVGRGSVAIAVDGDGKAGRPEGRPLRPTKPDRVFSEHHACPTCGFSLPEIEPRLFSFNSPHGACPECDGLGKKLEVDPDLVAPDRDLSVHDGALVPWSNPITTRTHRWKGSWAGWYLEMLEQVARRHDIRLDKPFRSLPKEHQKILLYGDGGGFEGVIGNLTRRYRETESEFVKEEVFQKYFSSTRCPQCKGARLKPEALAVTVGGRSITEVTRLGVKEASAFFDDLEGGRPEGRPYTASEQAIAKPILKEIRARLSFLVNVGLDYITLDRESGSLAGGEAQRIYLATQIGSQLVGVLYVLDEPTIGLHQRDNERLLTALCSLRDLGNTLIVVEHDEATIRRADWVVDLGPGAGRKGGHVVAAGPPATIIASDKSMTGLYLSGKFSIPVPASRRGGLQAARRRCLEIVGASQFNLKNVTVKIPLGVFVCVTGVSGSGKSTLIQEILFKALAQKLYHAKDKPGGHKAIKGLEFLDKVIEVDQTPIGRTPRSNPATYTGIFGPIRDLFSKLPESRLRGYKAGRFSFNVKGGRCENCEGDGVLKIEMQFLPDVYVKCDVCHGARFNAETLQVLYRGKSIADVLNLTVDEALEIFGSIPAIRRGLQTLQDVGLGYITLGQSATTLSGGEAQRVKLSTELGRRATGRTLYLLDEPTTGLHFADVEKLMAVLHRLVETGNTVLVIEHNLDVVKTADWLIDLGPEGGDGGGRVVAEGTPEEVARVPASHTGRFLAKMLG